MPGSQIPSQPAPTPASKVRPTPKPDPFYGHEDISRLCARFISHLFACPDKPPSSIKPQTTLPHFIAYALHRTKLHSSVIYAALVLLQRLKHRFPTARGSSGHRLFLTAYMVASKVICDDTYSNKSWAIVGQGMFTLREINQMEREFCSYLEWEITVDEAVLSNFKDRVKRDFNGTGPYPTYSPQDISAYTNTNRTPSTSPNNKAADADTAPDGSLPLDPSKSTTPPSLLPTPGFNPYAVLQNAQHWNLKDSVLSNVGGNQHNHNIVIHNLTLCTDHPRNPPKREIIKGQSVLGLWTTIRPGIGSLQRGQCRSTLILPEFRSTRSSGRSSLVH